VTAVDPEVDPAYNTYRQEEKNRMATLKSLLNKEIPTTGTPWREVPNYVAYYERFYYTTGLNPTKVYARS